MARLLTIAALAAAACGPKHAPAPAAAPAPATPVQLPALTVQGATPHPDTQIVIGRAKVDVAAAGAAAIAELEKFIAAHPGDQTFVPDALLRLGSLHLDERDAAADLPDPEPAMAAASAKAIAALTRLVDGYPAYPRRDAALYLLGFAHDEAGHLPEALAAFQAVAALPSSTYATEAWFRIGDLRFTNGAPKDAARAYAEVVARPHTTFTEAARYKLGWSYYRTDDYPAAIAAFQGVLDAPDAPELRAEAMQYVAICLTEPDWDGDGQDDPAPRGGPATTATIARVAAHLGDGAQEVRRQIAEQAGDALHDEARDDEAAAIYRLVLATPVDLVMAARVRAKLTALSRGAP